MRWKIVNGGFLSCTYQHSSPSHQHKKQHPLEYGVATWHHQNSHLALHSPWQLYSSACQSASHSQFSSGLVLKARLKNSVLWACGFLTFTQCLCFAWQRCPSSLSTGYCWVKFHPFFTCSTKIVLLFTFVILQPLSETDEAPSMLYFHNICMILIETQARITRMTLKKSLFSFYNVTLQDYLASILFKQVQFSWRTGFYVSCFGRFLCSTNFFFNVLLPVWLALCMTSVLSDLTKSH